MRESQREALDVQPQGATGIWELTGRRILSWRNWESSCFGIYDRGEGEGIWQGTQHRLVFSLTPLPPLLLQIDGGPTRDVPFTPDAIGFYPAGVHVRTAGGNSRYAQVCWKPDLYRSIAPELPALPQLEPRAAFQDPLIGHLARALAYEIGQGTLDRLLAESLLAALAMRVVQRFGSEQPQHQPDLTRLRLRRVLEYIDAHLDQDLTLAELANIACLSPCHFSRSFKNAYGVGPQRYTVQRRVERAKALLLRGDETLAGIAAAVGFADQSHFTAAFRRESGMTPGRFRTASV